MSPRPVSPEQRFAAFRQGDRQALGDVFDRCAPELLRVAAHASGSITAAEDAVQATFLAAIEHAARWDEQRPLMPWLIGILGNQLRTLRERSARPLDPARRRPAPDAAPDVAAMAAEFERELTRALDRLAPPYRAPLVLHLQHGLSAAAIAHAQGVPASTVRNQLARGLELLRTHLPVGLASALALTLTPARGLAAVKSATLGAAPTAAKVLTTTLVMHGSKTAYALALAGLLAAGVWSLAPRRGDPRGDPRGEAPGVPAATAAGASRAAASPTPPPRVAAPSDAAAPAPARASVSGDLRDERGVAIAGARIVAWNTGAQRLPDLAEATREHVSATDADGRFVLPDLPPGSWCLISESPAAAPATARRELAAGQQLRDVKLIAARGRTIHGRVHDDRGAPIVGASVGVRRAIELTAGMVRRMNPAGATVRTAADGTFQLGGLVADSSEVFAAAVGHLAATRSALGDDVELLLPRAASLRVAVLDPRAQPVAGARVWLAEAVPTADAGAPTAAAATGADGRATLTDQPAGTRHLCVASDHHPTAAVGVELRAGDALEQIVQLSAGGSVEVTVRDAAGRAVAAATVTLRMSSDSRATGVSHCQDDAGDTLRPMRPGTLRRATTAADGKATLRGLPSGQFSVDGEADTMFAAASVPIDCRDGAQRSVDLTLLPAARLRVQARDDAGAAAAGAQVRLSLAAAQYDMTVDLVTDPTGRITLAALPAGDCTLTLLTRQAVQVDGAGQISLPSEVEGRSVSLGLLPGHLHEVELREPRAFTYHAQVRDLAGGIAGAVVALGRAGQDHRPTHRADADGHVTIAGLVEGRYVGVFARGPADPASPLQLEVRADGIAGPAVLLLPTGSLRVTLRSPRGPVAGAQVLAPERAVFGGREMRVQPDGKGGVTVTDLGPSGVRSDGYGVAVLRDLAPGRHAIQVDHDDFVRGNLTAEVGTGEAEAALELVPAGRVLVHARAGSGTPPPSAWVRLARWDEPPPAAAAANGAGTLVVQMPAAWRNCAFELAVHGEREFTALPAGRYRAQASPLDGMDRAGEPVEFAVRAGQRAEVSVTVPD